MSSVAQEAWLASIELTPDDAREVLDGPVVACGCAGSPLGAGSPCYCELLVMKAQAVLGREVTGSVP